MLITVSLSVLFSFGIFASEVPTAWSPDYQAIPSILEAQVALPLQRVSPGKRIIPNLENLSAERLAFEVDGVSYVGKRHHLEDRGADNYTWYGYVGGSQFLSTVTRVGDKVFANLKVPIGDELKEFLVKPSMVGHVVDKVQAFERPGSCEVAYQDFSESELVPVLPSGRRRAIGKPSPNCPSGQGEVYTVDLLFLYDKNVLVCPPDFPEQYCHSAESLPVTLQGWVDTLNAVLLNSQIYNGRFRLVGMVPTERQSEGDLYADVDWADRDPWAMSAREEYKADVVYYLVWKSTVAAAGLGGGSHAVQAINVGANVFVHEIGHVLGLFHQPEDHPALRPGPTQYNFAHGVESMFRTAVGVSRKGILCENCSYIPVYSNPHVFYRGMPVGIPNERDNARRARQSIVEDAMAREGTPSRCEALFLGGNKIWN